MRLVVRQDAVEMVSLAHHMSGRVSTWSVRFERRGVWAASM